MSTSLALEGITLGMVKERVPAWRRFDAPMEVFGTEVHLYGLYGGIVGGLVAGGWWQGGWWEGGWWESFGRDW